MKKKSRKIFLVLIVLVLLAAAGLYFRDVNSQIQFQEETARTMDIRTYYTFSGNVEPDGFRIVTATSRGTVKEWKFEEGDEVEEDDVILQPKSGTKYDAPIDGTISHLYLDAGDDYVPGDKLFRVADYAHPVVKIKVDEYDVSAITKGMPVEVKIQATGKKLSGEVTRIAQEATVENNLAYYEAEIALPQDGTLAMGLTCEVIVPRESAEDATTVSVSAIQYDENGKPYVYCYSRGDEIVKQTVLLGISNGTVVEIRDGVKSGETILVPPSFPMMPMMMGR